MKDSVAGATTRLETLKALRLVLARAIDNDGTLARDLSSLARRLMDVDKEIELLERERQRDIEAMGSGGDDEKWDPAAI